MQAAFLSGNESGDWHDVESLLAGMPSGDTSVVAQVGISMESGSKLQVSVQASAGHSCFQDIRCVHGIVYIGYGQCLFVVHPDERNVQAHLLDGYFGHLYAAEELQMSLQEFAVLVASASELLSFSADGKLQWRANDLGIDGVVVHAVQGGVVTGSGEWAPPGGWRPFRLATSTGESEVIPHIES